MDKRGPGIITPKSTLGSYSIIKCTPNLTRAAKKIPVAIFWLK